MRKPEIKLPAEDPKVVAAREKEQRRAENARAEETQALLIGATARRLRRTGKLGSKGAVPIYGGGGVTAGTVGGGTRAGGAFSGGGVSGAGVGSMPDVAFGFSRNDIALY